MEEKVMSLVAEATKTDVAKISRDTSFIDDLNLDSLDIVELMMKLEDETGIEIPESEAEKLKTVGNVLDFIKNKQ
jgi:acyl carrier protein